MIERGNLTADSFRNETEKLSESIMQQLYELNGSIRELHEILLGPTVETAQVKDVSMKETDAYPGMFDAIVNRQRSELRMISTITETLNNIRHKL